VTVTYGSRAGLAEQVLHAALREGVGHAIAVLNGASPDTRERLRRRAAADTRITVVELERNLGSATGFGAGIRAALGFADTQSVWLLDDDNVARPGALSELIARRSLLPARADDTALLSYRTGLGYMSASLALGARAYPDPSSFLDFHGVASLRRRIGRLRTPARPRPEVASLPYAPYGGLLLPRALLSRVGLPDTRFVIYTDDTEFTARIVAGGGEILLVRDSVIDDIALSGLAAKEASRRIPKWAWFAIPDDSQAYYAMRNSVAFGLSRAPSRRVFIANGTVIVCWLLVLGLASRRFTRLRIMLRAILDGLRGRLGETHPLPSP
jgi:GT2 family glycosyltransferase